MATEPAIKATPTATQVGVYRYGITFDGDESYDHGYLGICLNMSRRIKIDPRQSDTEIPQTFLHKILHALGCTYEIDAWRGHTHDDHGRVTDKIDLMSAALLGWIRSNPEIVKWLQETV
jgi:hypothetical protein